MTASSSTSSAHYYQVQLRYRYKINKINFSNKNIYVTDIPLLNKKEAEALVDLYSIGSIHEVYFDPQTPSNSVLKTGVSNILILFTAPTLLFLSIGFSARKRAA